MRRPKVTILYDAAEESEAAPWSPLVSEQARDALAERGYPIKLMAAGRDVRDLARRLDDDGSDLVFNLCESLGGVSQLEQNVAALLELLGKRFTGAGSLGLALAQDKALAKKVLAYHDIRCPRFWTLDDGPMVLADDLVFPLIVKPLNQDASIGIDSGSIVHDERSLRERIAWIETEIRAPALVEEFIDGRELYVGVLGNERPEALPILEWDFSRTRGDLPRIASSDAKWDETAGYQDTTERFPQDIPERLYKGIQAAAVQAFQALKLRDYARVDVRLRGVDAAPDAGREYFVIEVNPNPHLDHKGEFRMMARRRGLGFAGMFEQIIELAMARQP